MKQMKRMLSLLLAFSLLFTAVAPGMAYAAETNVTASANEAVNAVDRSAASEGILVSTAPASGEVNLTEMGNKDWFYTTDGITRNRKLNAEGTAAANIIGFERLDGKEYAGASNSELTYIWSDGTPNQWGEFTTKNICFYYQVGKMPEPLTKDVGYRLTIPASKNVQTLYLISGATASVTEVSIYLNGSSEAAYVNNYTRQDYDKTLLYTITIEPETSLVIEGKLLEKIDKYGSVILGGVMLSENEFDASEDYIALLREAVSLAETRLQDDLTDIDEYYINSLKAGLDRAKAALANSELIQAEAKTEVELLQAAITALESGMDLGTYANDYAVGLVTSFGWEGDKHAPILWIDGTYQLRDNDNKLITFGVKDLPADSIKWYNAEGYLPCFVSEYSKNSLKYKVETFADLVEIDGNPFEVAYSRVTCTNNNEETVRLPAVSSDLIPLNEAAQSDVTTIDAGETIVREYCIGADRFGGTYAYPDNAVLANQGSWETHYTHMKDYWNGRLAQIIDIQSIPDEYAELINAYKAGYIYTLIIADGYELNVGENGYDDVYDHDVIGILATMIESGHTENFADYVDLVQKNLMYPDAHWKYSWPFALYLQKTGDFDTVVKFWDNLKKNTHEIEADRVVYNESIVDKNGKPARIMKITHAIDSDGYWTIDNWASLFGLTTYSYICDRLYTQTKNEMYKSEYDWAQKTYEDLLGSVEAVLKHTMDTYDINYIPISMVMPNEDTPRADIHDGNWLATYLFGRWDWDGYLFGADQSSWLLGMTDQTYDYVTAKKAEAFGTPYNQGAYPGYSSAYNAGYFSAALSGEKWRDGGIEAYLWMINNSMTSPYGWWESVFAPDESSVWNSQFTTGSGGGGSNPHMWAQSTISKVLIDSFFAEKADGTIIAGRGMPESFNIDGETVQVSNYLCNGGKRIGFTMTTEGKEITFTLTGDKLDNDVSLELLALVNNIKSVSGGLTFNNKAGTVLIPAGTTTVTITMKEEVNDGTSDLVSVTIDENVTAMNLTEMGTKDWMHVNGTAGKVSVNQKNHDGSAVDCIKFEPIGDVYFYNRASAVAFSWTDGAPTATATDLTMYADFLYKHGDFQGAMREDLGWKLTVPASENAQTLTFVAGINWATSQISIYANGDTQNPVYVETETKTGDAKTKTYTLTIAPNTEIEIRGLELTKESIFGGLGLGGIALSESVFDDNEDYTKLLNKAMDIAENLLYDDISEASTTLLTSAIKRATYALDREVALTNKEAYTEYVFLTAATTAVENKEASSGFANVYANGLTSSFGWEGDKDAPIAWIDGTYQLRDNGNKVITFGVTNLPEKSINWYNAEGYLPCFVSEYSKKGVDYKIENFADEVIINGNRYEIAYSRVTATNNSDSTKFLPRVSGDLIPLNDAAKNVKDIEAGETVVREYCIGADRFGGTYAYPTDAELAAQGSFDTHYAHMKNYWNERLDQIVDIKSMPEAYSELINAYKAGYIYTLIVADNDKLHVGENNYDRVFDHDVIGMLATLIESGHTENFAAYAKYIMQNVQYDDAAWKYSWPFALYLQKTGDFDTVSNSWNNIKTYTHKISEDRVVYDPSILTVDKESAKIMKRTNAIDSAGYWTIDNWASLFGLTTYSYLCNQFYAKTGNVEYKTELEWAKAEYESLLKSVEAVLKNTMEKYDFAYIPISMILPNEKTERANVRDGNWAATYLFGRWDWDGYLFGADQDSWLLALTDATYDYITKQKSTVFDSVYNMGGYPDGYYSSTYNAGYFSAGLSSETWRDGGIEAYLWMLNNSMTGLYGWWESIGNPDNNSVWNRDGGSIGGGSCQHMWGQSVNTKVLIDSFFAEKADGTIIAGRGLPAAFNADGETVEISNYLCNGGKRIGFTMMTEGNVVTFTLTGDKLDNNVSLELLAFVNNIKGVSAGCTFDAKAGTVMIPAGTTSVTVTMTDAVGTEGDDLVSVEVTKFKGATGSTSMNLTEVGSTDWMHISKDAINRKKNADGNAVNLIGFETVGELKLDNKFGDSKVAYSWTDGTVTESVSGLTEGGVMNYKTGTVVENVEEEAGWKLTVPASDMYQTLRFITGVWEASTEIRIYANGENTPIYKSDAVSATGDSVLMQVTVDIEPNTAIEIRGKLTGKTHGWGNVTMSGIMLSRTPVANDSVSVEVAQAEGSMNLTELGTTDWMHVINTGTNRKKGADGNAVNILGFETVGVLQLTGSFGSAVKYDWTDGTRTESVSNLDRGGVLSYQNGSFVGDMTEEGGWKLTVPASDEIQTLTFVTGAWEASTEIQIFANGDTKHPVYTSTEVSAGSNSTLMKVTVTIEPNTSIEVRGTLLAKTHSYGNLTMSGITLSRSAIPYDSVAVETTVAEGSMNLTELGTTDWMHVINTGTNRKKGADGNAVNILGFETVGVLQLTGSFGSAVKYSWTDGTPTERVSELDRGGVLSYQNGSFVGDMTEEGGWKLTVPASDKVQTLSFITGAWEASTEIQIYVNGDTKHPVYTSTEVSAGSNSTLMKVTVTIEPNTSVEVHGTLLAKTHSYGNLTMSGITLSSEETGPAAEVIALIHAIGEVTLESEEAIAAARTAYEALTEEQKAKVENINVLIEAEAKLAELKDAIVLEIVTQPENFVGVVGEDATFTVEVTRGDATFQWMYSNNNGETWAKSTMDGADSNTLTVNMTQRRVGQQYKVVATDPHGNAVTSEVVTLSKHNGPVIVTEPADVTASIGQNVTISVVAAGEGLTYQWMYSNNGKSWAKSTLDGANSDTLTVNMTQRRVGQQYKVVVTDQYGNVVESQIATLGTVTGPAPVIVTNPVDSTAAVGEDATFTVAATGEGLTYQWFYSNNGIYWMASSAQNANTDTMTIAVKAFRIGQQYKCVVTDVNGNTVESAVATILGAE